MILIKKLKRDMLEEGAAVKISGSRKQSFKMLAVGYSVG